MLAPIVIADDHPLFRAALATTVSKVWPDAQLAEAPSLASAREALDTPADLVLLDLHMEDSTGLTALMDLRADFPALPIVVVSASEEPRAMRAARQLGAAGFVPKSSDLDAMREAFAAVREGDESFPPSIEEGEDDPMLDKLSSLTPAQRRILGQIRAGLLNKQIAYELGISEATVKAHITSIFRKLDVVSRTQAVIEAARLDVDNPAAA